MDRFVNLTTIGDRLLANRVCQSLEDAGIPVMLEHVEIVQNLQRTSGFRLLVPLESLQTAQRLADATARLSFSRRPSHAWEAKLAG